MSFVSFVKLATPAVLFGLASSGVLASPFEFRAIEPLETVEPAGSGTFVLAEDTASHSSMMQIRVTDQVSTPNNTRAFRYDYDGTNGVSYDIETLGRVGSFGFGVNAGGRWSAGVKRPTTGVTPSATTGRRGAAV